ncbi:MAG: hypothetical protein M4579_003150 [Chaenotheca gracillima]|nr:MAG: hypothetical protein M4579_003150 [Chaenotheca gracillima]
MDYGYFAPPPAQPYQFLGFPPTPAHTNSAHSEEQYGNGSPQDFPEQPFQNYDSMNGQSFEEPNDLINNVKASKAQHRNSIGVPISNDDASLMMDGDQEPNGARSSSEEKEGLTPAQSRRKAQNRAAQRAFRERKERHVKDLELKLTSLEQSSTSLVGENDRLKRELQKVATENEILRATSSRFAPSNGEAQGNGNGPQASGGPAVVGPMRYSPTDFYSNVLQPHENKTISHRITVSESTGERLLAAGATWDLIQEHPLFKQGLVDVGDVCDRIKGIAKCDGQGPVFEERDIREAIEASAASGRDELI